MCKVSWGENKRIPTFPNEDIQEAFYDMHGYEPDEQPPSVTKNMVYKMSRLSFSDFAKEVSKEPVEYISRIRTHLLPELLVRRYRLPNSIKTFIDLSHEVDTINISGNKLIHPFFFSTSPEVDRIGIYPGFVSYDVRSTAEQNAYNRRMREEGKLKEDEHNIYMNDDDSITPTTTSNVMRKIKKKQ